MFKNFSYSCVFQGPSGHHDVFRMSSRALPAEECMKYERAQSGQLIGRRDRVHLVSIDTLKLFLIN